VKPRVAPGAPRPALPAPGSALAGRPARPRRPEPVAALTNSHQRQAGTTVFLALDCPARGHHVQGGPAGRRTRSATPTLDHVQEGTAGACAALGNALARAYDDAVLPDGVRGNLAFTSSTYVEHGKQT
jgi:hypothetical protein